MASGGSNEPVFLVIHIGLNKSGSADRLHVISIGYGAVQNALIQLDGSNSGSLSSINQIDLNETGVRQFAIGSRVTLYKVARQ